MISRRSLFARAGAVAIAAAVDHVMPAAAAPVLEASAQRDCLDCMGDNMFDARGIDIRNFKWWIDGDSWAPAMRRASKVASNMERPVYLPRGHYVFRPRLNAGGTLNIVGDGPGRTMMDIR